MLAWLSVPADIWDPVELIRFGVRLRGWHLTGGYCGFPAKIPRPDGCCGCKDQQQAADGDGVGELSAGGDARQLVEKELSVGRFTLVYSQLSADLEMPG